MRKTLAITDCRIPSECEARLSELGFEVLKLPLFDKLPSPLASHTDMLIFLLGDTLVTSLEYYNTASDFFKRLREYRPELNIIFSGSEIGRSYPGDCILNALVIGDKLFCKSDTVSESIKELAVRRGLKIIPTKQGYPACTVLKAGDSTAITADAGMYRVLTENGINTTLIQNGSISLPPYEYGFIGGCCGALDGTVYFLGDPKRHISANTIIDALRRDGYEYISLYDGELLDLGGILFT
jgi:hypothetical protein